MGSAVKREGSGSVSSGLVYLQLRDLGTEVELDVVHTPDPRRPERLRLVPTNRKLRGLGFDVSGRGGRGHSVWYGFFHEVMGTLDAWLSEQPMH